MFMMPIANYMKLQVKDVWKHLKNAILFCQWIWLCMSCITRKPVYYLERPKYRLWSALWLPHSWYEPLFFHHAAQIMILCFQNCIFFFMLIHCVVLNWGKLISLAQSKTQMFYISADIEWSQEHYTICGI